GNEANTKGNLGSIRSALSIYYGDMEGWYPSDTLATLTLTNKYINAIPVAKTPSVAGNNIGHPDNPAVLNSTGLGDAGGWLYDNVTADGNWGRLLVNCSHTDTRNSFWTSY